MTQLTGADAEGPTTTNVDVFGFYPDHWTREEVATCGARGMLPIKVPSQSDPWWQGSTFASELVSEAMAWGVPVGSPLVIDVEENQAEQMTAPEIKAWVQTWFDACHRAGLHPWIYSGATLFANTITTICNRWIAQYPDVLPTRPTVPAGYSGWQYHGDPNGLSGPDLDVFMPGVYMRPDASGTVLLGIKEEVEMPVVVHLTDPDNAPGKAPYWLLDDTATAIPEGTGDIEEIYQKLPQSNQWKVSYAVIRSRVVTMLPAGKAQAADKPEILPSVPATAEDDTLPTSAKAPAESLSQPEPSFLAKLRADLQKLHSP